jgi:hypothetical protein
MKTRNGMHLFVTEGLTGSLPVIGCSVILFCLLMAACSTPGSPLASETPSQTDEARTSSPKPTPSTTSAGAPTETRGEGFHPLRVDLPDLGPAPELENKVWLNTDQPLRLADLGGKVVLLDMWTFG